MPGHGNTVLVSYHLGQPAKMAEGLANGAILALTHIGLALILVLAGFAVISKAFAYGGRTPQFETASGVLIALIGACRGDTAPARLSIEGSDRQASISGQCQSGPFVVEREPTNAPMRL
jgi:hypothetical protein